MATHEPLDIKSTEDFDNLLTKAGGCLVVAHFYADWAPQCSQVTDVLNELAKDKACAKVKFVKVEAEEVPEVSIKYEIEAVPTVIFLLSGKLVGRVDGVKIAEITQKTRQLADKSTYSTEQKKPVEDLNTRLKRLINAAEVMVFMKGQPSEPRCGFSKQLVSLLQERNVRFGSFDILTDDEVRQGLKTFSNWPTYPQVYVKGELIGGIDIIKEMIENDEFDSTFPEAQSLEDRLKSLINKAPVMLFMKGDRNVPRCGFSRQVIELLNSKKVQYETFDILEDNEVRQGLKEFSDWPTYPQLYVKGELIGGLDILREMDSNDEFDEALLITS